VTLRTVTDLSDASNDQEDQLNKLLDAPEKFEKKTDVKDSLFEEMSKLHETGGIFSERRHPSCLSL
jgi:hypothetical protein